MHRRGVLLADHGFTSDPGRIERTDSTFIFYHYTREERAERVLEAEGGLWARLPVVMSPPGLEGCYLVEALLEPLPLWMTGSPYFGDLGFEMLREFVGDLLLRIELPRDFPGLYVADYAHALEGKHVSRRGRPALELGYDTSTGKEMCMSEANSYIRADQYRGGHVAPSVKVTRRDEGLVVPSKYIAVSDVQPLRALTVIRELRGKLRVGRKLTREEMNER